MIARIATFDNPRLKADDARRAATLRELIQSLPGFIAGYQLHEHCSPRLMDISIWESEDQLERAQETVARRAVDDQRGIRPSRIERWMIDASF